MISLKNLVICCIFISYNTFCFPTDLFQEHLDVAYTFSGFPPFSSLVKREV